jgi:hypothetical protein
MEILKKALIEFKFRVSIIILSLLLEYTLRSLKLFSRIILINPYRPS